MELYTLITTLENYLALSSKVEISNNLSQKQCCSGQQKPIQRETG